MSRLKFLLTVVLCFGPLQAIAQEITDDSLATIPVAPTDSETSSSPDAGSARTNRFVEEVVVTAQKREENLQDVPISVQAFSADALDARGIDEPKALQLATPGMSYNVFAGYSLIYIRGIGTDAFIPSADASVATYIDNIYYPFGHGLASALGAVERVEVLKGPQGTLFGRNSTGGAINIVTKQPGPDFESEITLTGGSYDKTNVRAYTNVPLTDSLSFSVSGLYYREESYYDLAAISPRSSLPPEVSRAFAVKAGWHPIDELEAVFGYTYINTSGGFAMSLPASAPKPLGFAAGVREQKAWVTSENAPVYLDNSATTATADIKYSAPWFDTRIIVGDQSIKSPALADYDGSNIPLTSFESKGQFADTTTAEFQILSNADSWNAEKLTYIFGIYYIDSSAGYDPLGFTLAPGLATGLLDGTLRNALGGIGAPAVDALMSATMPLFNQLSSLGITPLNILNNGVNLSLQGVLDTNAAAGFFQSTYNFTDQFAITLGGRYQQEKRRLVKSTTRVALDRNDLYNNLIPVCDFNAGCALGKNQKQKANTSNFSPKVVLDFKPLDGHLAYVSYTKGFKSGTFNIVSIYTPTQYVEPEEVQAYELGYKSSWMGGALRLNGAVFQNEITDLQVQTISLTSGGAVRLENAGKARIRGAEFDIVWQLAPDTLPGLVLSSSGAYLDGKYTDYTDGSGFDQLTGVYRGGLDFTGNRMVRTPKFSGTVGPSYTFDFDSSSLELASDVYYNSGSYFSAQNTETAHQEKYTIVNARVSYHYQPWDMRVTAMVQNLTDKQYAINLQELDFATARLLAAPRAYGLKLQWAF